jgi:hypothetical protein
MPTVSDPTRYGRPNEPADALEAEIVSAIWWRYGGRYFEWPIALEYAKAVAERLRCTTARFDGDER